MYVCKAICSVRRFLCFVFFKLSFLVCIPTSSLTNSAYTHNIHTSTFRYLWTQQKCVIHKEWSHMFTLVLILMLVIVTKQYYYFCYNINVRHSKYWPLERMHFAGNNITLTSAAQKSFSCKKKPQIYSF